MDDTDELLDATTALIPPLLTAIATTGTVEVTETSGEKLSMFISDGFAQIIAWLAARDREDLVG